MSLQEDPTAALPAHWPKDAIEYVGACPVCGSEEREIMHRALRDNIFHSPSGSWDLQRCCECGSGYLDPRPTTESIHLAYLSYHTHSRMVSQPADKLNGRRWLERVFANGYKNWKFGTALTPASWLGVPVAFLLPAKRAILNRQFRNLPRRPEGGRVLDVGFGDATFLENARAMGWQAVGTDFDPEVVKSAQARGLDARLGTVDAVEGPFDVITMSHVIEHLHDPVAVLRECYQLLAPGGTLWVETPSVEATGLRRFGADWRGLEPPRHLVLFSGASLKRAMRAAGFGQVSDLRQPNAVTGMYQMSQRIRDRADPYTASHWTLRFKMEIVAVKLFEWLFTRRREFLAVAARKIG